ncbi:hypothetical protein ABTL12_20760, partial [Acinetobacter baumannii]
SQRLDDQEHQRSPGPHPEQPVQRWHEQSGRALQGHQQQDRRPSRSAPRVSESVGDLLGQRHHFVQQLL